MGDGGISAVADAGPILHLNEIGAIGSFSVFYKVIIGDIVRKEITGQDRLPEAVITQPPFQRIECQSFLQEFIQEKELNDLHPGECECLLLCKQESIPILLTDDMAAREKAKHLNITPVGSIGILIRAYRKRIFTQIEVIEKLHQLQTQSSLFVSSVLIDWAIEHIQKIHPATYS